MKKSNNNKNLIKYKLYKILSLNMDQILIAADKNMGYVCIDPKDLWEQYEDINRKQHFGKVIMKEDWYLKNINNFLKEASEQIPVELYRNNKKNQISYGQETNQK